MRTEDEIRKQIKLYREQFYKAREEGIDPVFWGVLEAMMHWVLDDGELEARLDRTTAVKEVKNLLGIQ